jgi:hypothetical protein
MNINLFELDIWGWFFQLQILRITLGSYENFNNYSSCLLFISYSKDEGFIFDILFFSSIQLFIERKFKK